MTAPPVLSPLLTIESEADLAAILAGDYKSALMWLGKELDAQRAEVARLQTELDEARNSYAATLRDWSSAADIAVARLKAENDRFAKRHSAQALTIAQYQAECDRLRKVLKG